MQVRKTGSTGLCFALRRRSPVSPVSPLPHFLGLQSALQAKHLVDYALQWLPVLIRPARDQLLLLLASSKSLRTKLSAKERVSKSVHNCRPAKAEQVVPAAGGQFTGLHGKYRYAAGTASSSGVGSLVFVCIYALSLWLDAGMAADPLLHVVVKLQGTEDLLCYLKAATLAVQVFKTCKIKGTLP